MTTSLHRSAAAERSCRQCGALVDLVVAEPGDLVDDQLSGVVVVLTVRYQLVPCGHGWTVRVDAASGRQLPAPPVDEPAPPAPAPAPDPAPATGRHRAPDPPPRRRIFRRRPRRVT